MPTPSSRPSGRPPLAGQLVVFTGKLTLLGRKDARALVSRLGGETGDDVNVKTTLLVVGAEGFGHSADESASRDKSNKLRRAEELNAQQRAAIRIVPEDEFCAMVGLPSSDALKKQYYAVRDLLARYRALREDHVRYLIKYGVIGPVLRTNAETYFTFQDVAIIKQANDELAAGASFRSVLRSLVASREGQLAFDFRIDAAPARIVALRKRTPPPQQAPPALAPNAGQRATAMAEDYFRAASQLDEDDAHREEAAALYRKALELDPYLAAALINLANIHYGRDELAEAQALYERAIGLEADFFEAHFNLGNIYHDLGQFADAQACYREALRLNATYPDAHFYLAVTLEKMGLSNDARPHWRAYQNLAPHGEWVQLAKEFSD